MTTVSVRVEDSMLKDLSKVEKKWQADRSEVVRRLLVTSLQEWKVQNALENIKQHKWSIGKAAEECGLSLWDMLDLVKKENIDWTGYSKEDLEKDLAILQRK